MAVKLHLEPEDITEIELDGQTVLTVRWRQLSTQELANTEGDLLESNRRKLLGLFLKKLNHKVPENSHGK